MAMTSERRLARSTTDRKLAGVCGGLAEYLGVDPNLIRVIWIVLSFFPGPLWVAYVILWAVLPEDTALPAASSSAVRIAEERYARGEISAEQLESIRRDLA